MIKAALALVVLAVFASSATLYGTVYDENFAPAQSQVTVNSTPAQVAISPNGSYAFELNPGSYHLQASSDNLAAEKYVHIVSAGTYRIDLVLLPSDPPQDPDLSDLLEDEVGTDFPADAVPQNGSLLWLLILGLLVTAGAYAWYVRTRPTPVENPTKPSVVETPLTDAQKTVLNALDTFNGRASQKELRKALAAWSEARVSMELTELEDRGLIRKIKRGRGNIIRKTGSTLHAQKPLKPEAP